MANSKMTLMAFRVTEFRSVDDSGWVDLEDITALIGTNESGKTNLLLPLWKLKPAKDGEINLLADAPRKDYNKIRGLTKKPIFITARFKLSEALASKAAALTERNAGQVGIVEVSRDYDGHYSVKFPEAVVIKAVENASILAEIESTLEDISNAKTSGKGDETLRNSLVAQLGNAKTAAMGLANELTIADMDGLKRELPPELISDAPARSTVAPRFGQLLDTLERRLGSLTKPRPGENDAVIKLVVENLPSFVYYSTYGNLDSEIYLPHVIHNLARKDLSGREEGRARTLRVLFDFVNLQPNEILELGKDVQPEQKPSEELVQQFAEKKKERSVLLQSASTELTNRFRDWWKQGEYRIRFEADGNHFRIWVSDDKRPEEIELEGRSTGLQWFLSFYLIFLVESGAAHHGCILLLDEPGMSLHPIAQQDLALFFENLSSSNQLIYTTHSPFLLDPDHLERVRAVYVDDKGLTVASHNLRSGAAASQSKSVYPVHAALGLSVSNALLIGCKPVVVEGQSDQFYMSGIKSVLIGMGKIKPSRELVFVPGSGVKSVKVTASILSGQSNELPVVFCDSDEAGKAFAKSLKSTLYENTQDKVLQVGEFSPANDAEIEDLFPAFFVDPIVDRYLRGPGEDPFSRAKATEPLVPAVEAYASKHGLSLEDGWKVMLSKLVRSKLTLEEVKKDAWNEVVESWQSLFKALSKN